MKNFVEMVVIMIVMVGICLLVLNKCIFAEVPIKYNSKVCKMEIITSDNIKNRNAKTLIENKVLEFCKDKYIYNINVTSDKHNYIYVIIYNDVAE